MNKNMILALWGKVSELEASASGGAGLPLLNITSFPLLGDFGDDNTATIELTEQETEQLKAALKSEIVAISFPEYRGTSVATNPIIATRVIDEESGVEGFLCGLTLMGSNAIMKINGVVCVVEGVGMEMWDAVAYPFK